EDETIPNILKKEKPKSKWDDEDVDENDIKESWEDEEELSPAPIVEPAPVKLPKKPAAKANEKEGKAIEAANSVQEGSVVESLDPRTEKPRQQSLVEEAEYKSTAELLGKTGDENTIDNSIPKAESDFSEYAELISYKLRPFQKSSHYLGLLKAVMSLSMTNLQGADAKDIASSVTAIASEKIKAEKEAAAGKKKTAATKKKQLQLEKDEDVVNAEYDDFDDYNFK
ncbi:hypothetical protein Leryth_010942, partial [Lithospermum erythrorhizon]